MFRIRFHLLVIIPERKEKTKIDDTSFNLPRLTNSFSISYLPAGVQSWCYCVRYRSQWSLDEVCHILVHGQSTCFEVVWSNVAIPIERSFDRCSHPSEHLFSALDRLNASHMTRLIDDRSYWPSKVTQSTSYCRAVRVAELKSSQSMMRLKTCRTARSALGVHCSWSINGDAPLIDGKWLFCTSKTFRGRKWISPRWRAALNSFTKRVATTSESTIW